MELSRKRGAAGVKNPGAGTFAGAVYAHGPGPVCFESCCLGGATNMALGLLLLLTQGTL